ncbi:MAG: hypothetical protein U0169_00040 [Polyangiaceae bacterium]
MRIVPILLSGSFVASCGESSVTISGTIVDDAEMPVVGATVRVGDKTDVTSVDGRFGIRGVDLPYDVAVVTADRTKGTRFAGIDSKEPRLRAFEHVAPTPRRARVHFRWDPPLGPDEDAHPLVLLADTESTLLGQVATRDGGAYDVDVRYAGGERLRLWAFALRYEVDPTTRKVARYVAHQWRPVDVVEGGTTEWTGLGYVAPGTSTVTVEASLPEGFAVQETRLRYRPAAPIQDVPVFLVEKGARSSATFPVPSFEGLRFDVEVLASGPNGSTSIASKRFVDAGTTVKLDLFGGPSPTSPNEGGRASVQDTRFECIDAGSGHFVVTLRPNAEEFRNVLPTFRVVAKNCRADFSPLASDLVGVPEGAAYDFVAGRSSVAYEDAVKRDAAYPAELRTSVGATRALVLRP